MSELRKQSIKDLEDFVNITKLNASEYRSSAYEVSAGTYQGFLLKNELTSELVQVFECVYNPDNSSTNELHVHSTSTEVFYQLTGKTIFMDGTIIHAGEMHIIPAGTPHCCTLSFDGSCIVILHPPDSHMPKGNE